MFFDAEAKVFDFAMTEVEGGFEAVFARVNVSKADLPETPERITIPNSGD